MNFPRIGIFLLVAGVTAAVLSPGQPVRAATGIEDRARKIVHFDSNWMFLKGDAKGAEDPAFDDSQWRKLSVPHDWAIEGPFDQNAPAGGAGAFLPSGVGWYRKHFAVPDAGPQARVLIEFDGVMANSDVWINGFHLGTRPYGYVSFHYELTGHLNGAGKENVIAVRADNSAQPASRWYSGAGIYRHVRLVVMAPVHLDEWGVAVSTPTITPESATVSVQSTIVDEAGTVAPVRVETTILSPSGQVEGQTESDQKVSPGQLTMVLQQVTVPNPQLWDIGSPILYHALVKVYSAKGTRPIDDELVQFGIREFHFDPATGFWLNGKNFKIKGACLHAEAGAVGAAVPLGVWERYLKELRALGVNAIRTAHNPPAPEFLTLCDRMGFLVLDELFDCWTVAKNPYDYSVYFSQWSKTDAADTIRRDRNHPSIILYSAGNEIHDTPNAKLAKGILKGLVDVIHANDPTRPVTQALFRPNRSGDYTDGLADMLDVVGQNYREREILAAHAQKPTRKIIGTENGHDRLFWLALRDNPPYAGQFLWSGVDYLGEARRWPDISRPTGLLDRDGTPHTLALQRQSWWSDKPMVRIARRVAPEIPTVIDPGYNEPPPNAPDKFRQVTFTDWSPATPNQAGENVEVYSNCDTVELFLNRKSLGSQALPADASPRKWNVPFEPGTLRAVGKNNGVIVATDELRTAGSAAKIALSADRDVLRPSWDDVGFVKASITDEDGVLEPNANDLVTFSISGPGEIVAVDNADNSSHEPFQAKERHAYQGKCYAIVRATGASGRITVTASAPGRAPISIKIPTEGLQSAAP
jgi:beta-galactosidase